MRRFSAAAFFLSAILFFGGCFFEKREVPPGLDPQLSALNMQASLTADGSLAMKNDGFTLLLNNGGMLAYINTIPILMPEAANMSEDRVWHLPERSASVILQPIIRKYSFPVKTVLIDPGHGGRDKGAVSGKGIMEKNLNLSLAKCLAYELENMGFKVFLTRSDDRFLTLDQRPALVEKYNADFFISIHHNASEANPAASGTEIFLLASKDQKQDELVRKAAYTAFLMLKEISFINKAPGRGLKTAGFKVLRLAPCPAILVETGFVSNPEEVRKISRPEYQRAFAAALARGLFASQTEN